ncbi:hypothetical protein HYT45_01500 [Candidatus Uhrbacteria bacterium]|nr:hypothetical protein [Candidatus Uhrbacteria bacterium]
MEIPKNREQLFSPEEVERIDAEINELLKGLDNYDFNSFDYDVQEEWISTEQECVGGLDRVQAKGNLERLLDYLKRETEERKNKNS